MSVHGPWQACANRPSAPVGVRIRSRGSGREVARRCCDLLTGSGRATRGRPTLSVLVQRARGRSFAREGIMAVVGSGDFRYEVVEGWEQLPAGWQHKDVAGVATDSKDRVYLITRSDARVIVYNKDGSFAAAW